MLLALLDSAWQTALSTHKTRNRCAAQQEISWVWQHVSRQGGSEPALVRQRATLWEINNIKAGMIKEYLKITTLKKFRGEENVQTT